MKRLCIIPCGAKKIWDEDPKYGSAQAKDVYQSRFHQLCQRYARAFFHDWAILSAKYGFLLPADVVEGNYDVAFGTKNPEIISIDELKKQIQEKKLEDYEQIVVLGGKKYTNIVQAVFGDQAEIIFPLAGCTGIGYMQQKLKQSIDTHQELTS